MTVTVEGVGGAAADEPSEREAADEYKLQGNEAFKGARQGWG